MSQEDLSPTVESSFMAKAVREVRNVINENNEKTDPPIDWNQHAIYIVWFAKTLQNWKALLSTTLPDGKYYEVTYNGEMMELYVDTYVKTNNTKVDCGYPGDVN